MNVQGMDCQFTNPSQQIYRKVPPPAPPLIHDLAMMVERFLHPFISIGGEEVALTMDAWGGVKHCKFFSFPWNNQ